MRPPEAVKFFFFPYSICVSSGSTSLKKEGVGVHNSAMANTPKSKTAASTHNKTLFIVESPNKVKTIEKYLGDNFIVRASIGHIADIPVRKGSVDVLNDFAPHYELTAKGAEVIAGLKRDMKQCSEVVLATDADREGEIIAAHLAEFLAPTVPVKRIVFHAVTKAAIEEALANPRDIDENLVEAARTRRILDRLFGFEVTGVSRQKVRSNTTAGRVQSPALRLVVEREMDRMKFISASYADVIATSTTAPAFTATMKSLADVAIATGKDFNAAGQLINEVTVLDMPTANAIANELSSGVSSLAVVDITEKAATRNPQPPFIMSSLYQDAINRLGMSMKEAQAVSNMLFEKGLITYPRTDNPVHEPSSRRDIRNTITALYGEHMVAPYHRYTSSKKKNAQGAHEAIRPTFLDNQSPKGLTDRQLAMYRMIWQRTIASQMIEATGSTMTVTMRTRGGEHDALFTAAGTTYTQPGFRTVYAPAKEDDNAGAPFPELAVGDVVPVASAEARTHNTTPPARFTEASLVKELENLGIGRPSTYASIIAKLRARYVWSKGGDKALIPTVTAFAVHRLLMHSFAELLDYEFTNSLEETLDQIAEDKSLRTPILNAFYFGGGNQPGLEVLITNAVANVQGKDMYALSLGTHPETGDQIIIRAGKMFGKTSSPYIECGTVKVSLPDQTEFDDLSPEAVAALLAGSTPRLVGHIGDVPLYIKVTKTSAYFQLGEKGNLPEGHKKPQTAGLLKSMNPDTVTVDDAVRMFALPRVVGVAANGETITATLGKFGGYISCGAETRSLKDDEQIFSITVAEAQALLDTPKKERRGKWKKKG